MNRQPHDGLGDSAGEEPAQQDVRRAVTVLPVNHQHFAAYQVEGERFPAIIHILAVEFDLRLRVHDDR